MASLTKIRAYHSIALLLPDGRVLSAGGTYLGEDQQKYIRLLIYSEARGPLSRRRPRALHTVSRFSWAHPMPQAFHKLHSSR